jgi:hypothetical protein
VPSRCPYTVLRGLFTSLIEFMVKFYVSRDIRIR